MRRFSATVVLLAAGCTSNASPDEPQTTACQAAERRGTDGACLAPGVRDDGCAAGTRAAPDGTCLGAGITPDQCGDGFAALAEGCVPVLPALPCAVGTMALPGDTACRAAASCGTGKWGDIPTEPGTIYVDATFAGVSSGAESSPWTTINEAIGNAPEGAMIAVAAGVYIEDVSIGKRLRLWGRCPGMVEVSGLGMQPATLIVIGGGSASEIHQLAVTGPVSGVGTTDALDVLLSGLWVHDTAAFGISSEDTLGTASVIIRSSLIEHAVSAGLLLSGASGDVVDVEIRDTVNAGGTGRAISVQSGLVSDLASELVASSLHLHRNNDATVYVDGSSATIERAAIHDTFDFGNGGVGMAAQASLAGQPASLVARQSTIEASVAVGAIVQATSLELDRVTIRGVAPNVEGRFGYGLGIQVQEPMGMPSSALVNQVLVANVHHAGIFVEGSTATIVDTLVREVAPSAGPRGIGLIVQSDCDFAIAGHAEITGCAVERTVGVGIFVGGANIVLDGSVVRDVVPSSDGSFTFGIETQPDLMPLIPSNAFVRQSLVERVSGFGVTAFDTTVAIEDLAVRDIVSDAIGNWGDGIVIISTAASQPAGLWRALSENNERAGLITFGTTVALLDSAMKCDGIPLITEPNLSYPAAIDDEGGNWCGCDDQVTCKSVSAQLQPPAPLDPIEPL